MKRAVAVVLSAFIGAVLGFIVGTVATDVVNHAFPQMDEYEYIWVGTLGALVVPVVGAIVGGVLGARVERRP